MQTTNQAGEWGGTISTDALIENIARMRLSLPKPDVFLSTRLFSGAKAMMVEGAQEKFIVAHPLFWARLEHETRYDLETDPQRVGFRSLTGIPIIEIDRHQDDSPERTAYIEDMWKRLKEAVQTALVELPEWLREAPKFGEHG
jgi:hypothetical protein